jgi:hypothetical protein
MKLTQHVILLFLAILTSGVAAANGAAPLVLSSPLDFQVFQRQDRLAGIAPVTGHVNVSTAHVQFRWSGTPIAGKLSQDWQPIACDPKTHDFNDAVQLPAGGWYRLDVRAVDGEKVIAETRIDHVGMGEVFVIAGQSNSTNYGSERQSPTSNKVATFDGSSWRIADDPQPGTQDKSHGGSFIPAFGDAMVERFKVPIGVASCGHGGTSVRQWLMRGEKIDVHPTTNGFVKEIGPGQWECTGKLFDGLMDRIAALGPNGFRAVLWHQGESDAGQARAGYPADRQISGEQYRATLEKIIAASWERAGWKFPWFVAQATYHSEKDPSDAEFRAAQKAVCEDKFAQLGPDTDALGAAYRAGVHFNPKGLKAHGELWAKKVGDYLDYELASQNSQTPVEEGKDAAKAPRRQEEKN